MRAGDDRRSGSPVADVRGGDSSRIDGVGGGSSLDLEAMLGGGMSSEREVGRDSSDSKNGDPLTGAVLNELASSALRKPSSLLQRAIN